MFTHAHVSMMTYHVHIYRSRPIGASLLTTSPEHGCLALKGLHTDWLGMVTGIHLIHIIAAATVEKHGGFLVLIIVRVRVVLVAAVSTMMTCYNVI